jgi:hypothetical protein
MVKITRDVPVAGQSSITETFSVPNGNNRHFLVEAKNASGNTVFRPRNDVFANLDGQPVTLTIDMKDVAPPTFGGLQSATAVSATRIDLSWRPATDNLTPAADIVYLIYQATTPGGQNFAAPNFPTPPGVTSFSLTGLAAGTYYFVVRARDAAENTDLNTVELSASTIEANISVVKSCSPVETANPTSASTVNVKITATVTNTGNETLNGITCSDSRAPTLVGVPASLAPGASATVSGSYSPTLTTGPYTDALTCSGTGALNGVTVSGNSSTSCNFAPALTITNSTCNVSASFDILSGTVNNSGDETVNNIICSGNVSTSPPSTITMFDLATESTTFQLVHNVIPVAVTVGGDFPHPLTAINSVISCTGTGNFSQITINTSGAATTCP